MVKNERKILEDAGVLFQVGAITVNSVLRAEHDLVAESLMTCENKSEEIRDNYNYIFGVNDLAEKLINTLEGKNG